MAFVTVPGLKGKVFDPQESDRILKKKPCKDCFSCQHCSEDRCRVCRGEHYCRCNIQTVKIFVGREDDIREVAMIACDSAKIPYSVI